MMSMAIGYLVPAILLCIALYILFRVFSPGSRGGIDGKLIWTDHGRQTKAFSNRTFKIFGKPDLMYRIRGGVKAVEYKHRNGPVFKSDIAQALAAALAARGEGYKVVQVLVKTRTNDVTIELKQSDRALYQRLEGLIHDVRNAKTGKKMSKNPERRKCYSCAYRDACQ